MPSQRRLALTLALACCLAVTSAHAAAVAPASATAVASTPGPLFDAHTLSNARKLVAAAHADTGAYAIVEGLTTEIGPRMAGSPAFERAMDWAEARFKSLGYDRVYREPVDFPQWERHHETGQVLSPFPQPLVLTALGGSVGTGGKPLDADVVQFATLDALKAAPAGSLAGKIAFISNRMERFKDGHGYGPAVAARSGASEASGKGAVALLIRSIGTDNDRMPHTGMQRYAEGAVKVPAAALSNPDADLLVNMLKRGKPVRVRLDIDVGFTGKTVHAWNVIGEMRGRGKLADEVVVIGGHLDSWDLGTGAIDDGAGVAISMAAGAMIGKLDKRPMRTIRVIAFANEEQGLLGGRAYAQTHKDELDAQQLGAESDFGGGRVYRFSASVSPAARPVVDEIATVLAPLGIAYGGDAGGASSDIGPFAKVGMPWAQLAQDGTDYFDYHHTANDTLDKLDAPALDQQAAAYAAMAYLAAQSPVDFGRSSGAGSE
jgi:hypothetical protein